jgi:hypothetical protein
VYVFDWGDQGAAGSANYGFTDHLAGGKMSGIVVEIKGSAAGPPRRIIRLRGGVRLVGGERLAGMSPVPRRAPCGAGSNITFTDIGGGQCRAFITTTGGSSFTVPTNWNSGNNSIETIGGGGAGYIVGGGGGAYAKEINQALSGSVFVSVGAGGDVNYTANGGDSYLCNSSAKLRCHDRLGTAGQPC